MLPGDVLHKKYISIKLKALRKSRSVAFDILSCVDFQKKMDILSQEQCLIECESEWPEITSQKNAKKNLEKQEIKTDSGSKQDCEGNATNTPLVTKTKHLEELISEINESNPRFEKSQLRDAFQFIESIYLSLRDVTLEFISAWANKVRNEEEYPSASEKIAFVWKAMELTSSHKIRSVQVLTVMMTYGSKQGEIAQVNTGEGKTIIIAMLTALLCLDDHKVDMGMIKQLLKVQPC